MFVGSFLQSLWTSFDLSPIWGLSHPRFTVRGLAHNSLQRFELRVQHLLMRFSF